MTTTCDRRASDGLDRYRRMFESSDGKKRKEIERKLLCEYAITRDPLLRDFLFDLNYKLVRFLAVKFSNHHEPLEDIIQVGCIGLIHAIDRYDPHRGTKFSTFATPTIIGEIRRYFRDKCWAIKAPRRLRELAFNLFRVWDKIAQDCGREPTAEDFAKYLEVPTNEINEAIKVVSSYAPLSLNAIIEQDDGDVPLSLEDFVGQADPKLASLPNNDDLFLAIKSLEPRQQSIIYARYFKGLSQTEIAKRLNLSQMQISRDQRKALTALRKIL